MTLIPDSAIIQKSLAALPLVTYQAGETVLADGSKTGRLLILKKGAVAIVKADTEIARVSEPGAVFGELSVLLDQPHTAEVCALEKSQFHVADAAGLLARDPMAVLYLATVLARRLDGANHALIQLKSQLQAGQPHSVVTKTSRRCRAFWPSAVPVSSTPATHPIHLRKMGIGRDPSRPAFVSNLAADRLARLGTKLAR